jgi:hypothetical protein
VSKPVIAVIKQKGADFNAAAAAGHAPGCDTAEIHAQNERVNGILKNLLDGFLCLHP